MAEQAYQPPEGYLTMQAAQQVLGISKVTMRKIVRDRGIETYRDPRDGRVRLLKREAVERLARPDPEGKGAA